MLMGFCLPFPEKALPRRKSTIKTFGKVNILTVITFPYALTRRSVTDLNVGVQYTVE